MGTQSTWGFGINKGTPKVLPVSAMDFKLVLIFVLLVLQESAGGKINNCDGKENGDSCLKGCKSPNCAAAKCWEGACLVKTKYDTISAIGKKQLIKRNKNNNNCEGKRRRRLFQE